MSRLALSYSGTIIAPAQPDIENGTRLGMCLTAIKICLFQPSGRVFVGLIFLKEGEQLFSVPVIVGVGE